MQKNTQTTDSKEVLSIKNINELRTQGGWYISGSGNGIDVTSDKRSTPIVTAWDKVYNADDSPSRKEAEANAQYICLAVNNFDAVLEALNEMILLAERLQDAWSDESKERGGNGYVGDSKLVYGSNKSNSPTYHKAKDLLEKIKSAATL